MKEIQMTRFAILLFCLVSGMHLYGQALVQLPVEGGTIHYMKAGEGEPVIFVHGTQEDYRNFIPMIELLRDDFMVVTYSRRYNFPNSSKLTPGFSPGSEAKDLEKLIQAIGAPVHIVGQSYGGLIAAQLAVNHPEFVQSLTLSEPPLVDWLKDNEDCRSYFEAVKVELVEETRAAFDTGDTTRILKEIFEFFAGADIQDDVPPQFLVALKQNLPEMEALVRSEKGFEVPSPKELSNLEMPVMILTAGQTLPVLKCTNRKLVETMTGAVHHHLNQAGHELWMTHPKECAAFVRGFLR